MANTSRSRRSTTRTRKKPPLEFFEQVGFLEWFESKFPRVRIFAIPNGGKRSIATAKKLKKEGVKAGVPDLFIPEWNVWVEMKRKKGGRVSPVQKDWHEYLVNSCGHTVIVGHGSEDASRQVMDFVKEKTQRE